MLPVYESRIAISLGWVPIASNPLPPPPLTKGIRKTEDEKLVINVRSVKII